MQSLGQPGEHERKTHPMLKARWQRHRRGSCSVQQAWLVFFVVRSVSRQGKSASPDTARHCYANSDQSMPLAYGCYAIGIILDWQAKLETNLALRAGAKHSAGRTRPCG